MPPIDDNTKETLNALFSLYDGILSVVIDPKDIPGLEEARKILIKFGFLTEYDE